jgi:hypothetical protein
MPWRILRGKAKKTCSFVPDGDNREHAEYTDESGNREIIKWEYLADCAHFVSCCLHAGGLQVPSFVAGVVGHFQVDQLVHWLHHSLPESVAHTFLIGGRRVLSAEVASAIISAGNLEQGDVIAYVSPGGEYKHSALHLVLL